MKISGAVHNQPAPEASTPSADGTQQSGLPTTQPEASPQPEFTTNDAQSMPGFTPTSTEGFTANQLVQMALWSIENGSMTHEQATAMLAESGIDMTPPDQNHQDVWEHMHGTFGVEPAQPHQYELPSWDPYGTQDKQAVDAFDADVRSVLSAAKF